MKTILITGSTDGIGKLTALQLAKDGHKVLIHGRNKEKVENTLQELKDVNNQKNSSGFTVDLSDFRSILEMINQLIIEQKSIDVLINNAGVFKSNRQQNQDNLDIRFAVNYFAPYLLTNGLIPLLKQSNSPRIINLSSAAQSPVSLEALLGKEQLSEQEAYAQSKLALTMWSSYLAQQWKEMNVIAVNPGSLLNTKMVKEAYGQFWSSANKGADILCQLATSTEFDDSSGKYFDNDQGGFNQAHTDAYDKEKIDQLIFETKKRLE